LFAILALWVTVSGSASAAIAHPPVVNFYPSDLTMIPGGSDLVFVDVASTTKVLFEIYYAPDGITAEFSQQVVTNSGFTYITVNVGPDVAPGRYSLWVYWTWGGGYIDYGRIRITVTDQAGNPGPMLWTKGSGTDTNWFSELNWTNPVAGGNGPPGQSNDVFFCNKKNDKTISAPGVVNNVVNKRVWVNSLNYTNAGGAHTTLISSNVTLTVNAGGLTAGAAGNPTTFAVETNAILGEGSLVLRGPLMVSQGASQADGHNVTLDLSGLASLSMTYIYDEFGYYVSSPSVGIGQPLAFDGTTNKAPSGTLYLAQNNDLYLTRLALGGNLSTNISSIGSALYLGQMNQIYIDDIETGLANSGPALIAFNPALTNRTAYFRGGNYTSTSVSQWSIADNSGNAVAPLYATNDFTGGYVDILASVMTVGRGSATTRYTGTGVLTFDNGIVGVDQLYLGEQTAVTGASGAGYVNVGTNAQLSANSLWLTYGAVPAYPTNFGMINISGGSVTAGMVDKAGGTATINVKNGGTLNITSSAGKPARALSTIALSGGSTFVLPRATNSPTVYVTNCLATNSTFRLSLDVGSPATNMLVRNLIVRGTNTLAFDSWGLLESPALLPLFSYTGFNGSLTNFALAGLPEGWSGLLLQDTVRRTIWLSVAPTETIAPQISSYGLVNSSFLLGVSGGFPGAPCYMLSSTNLALPTSSWTRATNLFDMTGNLVSTNAVDPGTPQRFFQIQIPW
jgi:hypothetical protein